jgi:glycosyltransferase involved in cell wall biosynthesis
LIVENHTPTEWAAALRRLVEDRPLRHTLGEAARAAVVGRWSMEHAADAMIAGLRLGAAQAPVRSAAR